MRYRRLSVVLCAVLATLAISTGSARAQTTAAGPYYATPSWDQTFACATSANCPRFVVLSNFGGQAVLDRETGLVWERSPNPAKYIWGSARYQCSDLVKGNRKGWRLPTVDELTSLVDPSGVSPTLPTGHPFQNVQFDWYWSATTVDAANASTVDFGQGFVINVPKSSATYFWCVRGGQGATQP